MNWMPSETFEDAVERLRLSIKEYLRPDMLCTCPGSLPEHCYHCSWEQNMRADAAEVGAWPVRPVDSKAPPDG